VVGNLDALPGEPVRARIRSRDVALALERPRATSFQNVLEGAVESVGREFGAIVDVELRVGRSTLVARITRESAERLGLAPGVRVYALVKAIAIDRRSVGYA
ncbi:MAG TPA: TOBE domain-containing protein, partial [Usitatibacter sp.]|nr:TOBE domain-containing protein [Usitatibacter sp.]